jgi:FMN phosphatase YigB (HAD superfamily)
MVVSMTFKKVILFLLILFSTFQTIFAIPQKIKGIIAADCHGVIVESKKWKRHRKISLLVLRHLDDLPFMTKMAFKILYKYFNQEKLSMLGVFQEFPELERYRDEIYDIRRLESPIPAMIALLKKLKDRGYLLVLASNLEPDVFAYNLKECPEYLDFFDFHFLSKDETDKKDTVYISKPNPQYFVDLRKKINEYAGVGDDVEIIFIDDRTENVESAAQQSELNIRAVTPEEFKKEYDQNMVKENNEK